MKDYLNNVISSKEERAKEIRESIDSATTVEEVQRMSKELESVQEEIRSAKEQLAKEDKEPEKRSFNPIATFSNVGIVGGEEAEKRAKELVKTEKITFTSEEVRSVLLSTGTLAKPTKVGGIHDAQNTVSSIIDQVWTDDATGMGEDYEAYVKAIQTAGMGKDGEVSNNSDPVFRTAAIRPFSVDVISYVSKNIRKQSPLTYAEKVESCAMKALRTKVGKLIISGNGSTEPYGIINAVNTEKTPEAIYDTVAMDSNEIDEKTLRKIVFAYGGDENVGGNAKLYLNKADLTAFGDVRGTSDKKAVYEIIPDGSNPNIGIIKDGGLSVPYCINSECTALSTATKGGEPIKTMVYGDPQNYKLDLYGDYEVRVSDDYKFGEKMLTVLGEVMLGGNVICDKGFVVVTL